MRTATKVVTISASVVVVAAIVFGGVQVATALNQLSARVKHSISLSTPTPTFTKAAQPTAVGSTVDPATAAKINAQDGGDVHAYQLANSSFVVVNTKQPLPAVVTADIMAGAAPVFAPFNNRNLSPANRGVANDARIAFAQKEFLQVGGTPLIFVMPAYSTTIQGAILPVTATFSSYGRTGIKVGAHATVLAAAQAWAAQNGARLFDLG